MDDITNQTDNKSSNTDQEEIMNRVNQTFEQMVQDVRNMIDENSQNINNQLS